MANGINILRRLVNGKTEKAEGHKRGFSGAVPVPDFGVTVNNDSALRQTAFYSGLRLISENIASLPKAVRVSAGGSMADDCSHPVYRLINIRPNGYTGAFCFWSTIVTWVKGWGNAYALIERDNSGRPIALHQVHPSGVRITLIKGVKWYSITMPNRELSHLDGTYKDDDVLHFMEVTLDGIKGVNPVIYNAAALGKSAATEAFAAEFYKRGGNIKGVMEMEGDLGDEAYEKFIRHFNLSAGNFETPLLEYGIKYKQLSIDPVAAQLVQSETFSLQDICRILNIPPHMIAELSHATFSNIEHQTIQFVQYSLRPIIKRIEMECEYKLFFEREQGRYDVKFNLEGLLRGDTTARAAFYHNAILDGYMTRNEVRALEGLAPLDGLDDVLQPVNYKVVGEEEYNQENNA